MSLFFCDCAFSAIATETLYPECAIELLEESSYRKNATSDKFRRKLAKRRVTFHCF
jgi:hypothetical protein